MLHNLDLTTRGIEIGNDGVFPDLLYAIIYIKNNSKEEVRERLEGGSVNSPGQTAIPWILR